MAGESWDCDAVVELRALDGPLHGVLMRSRRHGRVIEDEWSAGCKWCGEATPLRYLGRTHVAVSGRFSDASRELRDAELVLHLASGWDVVSATHARGGATLVIAWTADAPPRERRGVGFDTRLATGVPLLGLSRLRVFLAVGVTTEQASRVDGGASMFRSWALVPQQDALVPLLPLHPRCGTLSLLSWAEDGGCAVLEVTDEGIVEASAAVEKRGRLVRVRVACAATGGDGPVCESQRVVGAVSLRLPMLRSGARVVVDAVRTFSLHGSASTSLLDDWSPP